MAENIKCNKCGWWKRPDDIKNGLCSVCRWEETTQAFVNSLPKATTPPQELSNMAQAYPAALARIAELEKVLNMGYDNQDMYIGDAKVCTEKTSGHRAIPFDEIRRVLGKDPECPHDWSWPMLMDDGKHRERACKWCGAHEVEEIGDQFDNSHSWRNHDNWVWASDGHGEG